MYPMYKLLHVYAFSKAQTHTHSLTHTNASKHSRTLFFSLTASQMRPQTASFRRPGTIRNTSSDHLSLSVLDHTYRTHTHTCSLTLSHAYSQIILKMRVTSFRRILRSKSLVQEQNTYCRPICTLE